MSAKKLMRFRYCARSLDHRSAIKVSYCRGLLASKLSSSDSERYGMAAVGLSSDQVYAKLNQIQPDFDWSSITVSCINSPKNVTVSGPEDKIVALISHLQDQQIFARKLLVKVGYHSPQMSAIAPEYLVRLETLQRDLEFHSNKTTMISSVSCNEVSTDDLLNGEYWVQNMVSPVNFLGALELCCSSSKPTPGKLNVFPVFPPANTLMEIGPHSALQGPIRDILQSLGTDTEVTYTSPLIRNRKGTATFLATMGQLHCRGIKIDVNKLNRLSSRGPHFVQVMKDLPQYPFNHSITHWDESNQSRELRIGDHVRNKLLGAPGQDWNILRPTWRLFIRSEDLDWVKDHKVDGSILYPAAGMLAMAIEAIKQLTSRNNSEVIGYEIKEVRFHTALVVPDTHKGVETQICLLPSSGTVDDKRAWYEFRIYSDKDCDGHWTENCYGFIRADMGKGSSEADFSKQAECHLHQAIITYEDALARCQIEVNKSKVYRIFRELGLDFGPCFQRLDQLFVSGSNESISNVMIQSKPEILVIQDDHEIHPTTLDAVFQSVYVALCQGSAEGLQTMVPSRIGKLWLSSAGSDEPTNDSKWQVYTKIVKLGHGGARGDIITLAESRQLKVEVHDIEITTIPGSKRSFSDEKEDSRLGYGMTWKADLATLSLDQAQEYCESASELKVEPIQWRRDLEFSALAFAHAALLELRRLEQSPLSPHLKKYLSWIETQVDRDLSAAPEDRLLDHEGGHENSEMLIAAGERLSSSRMGKVFVLVGQKLTQILLGEIDPLQLLFHDEYLIQGFYDEMNEVSRCLPSLANYLDLVLHKTPGIKILEIGAGTGATTKILNHILAPRQESPRYGQYDFTDVSPSFFSKAKEYFLNDKLMNFCTLDVEKDLSEQGFLAGTYDLVIAANVLHATKDLKKTLENVRRLLKPGGKLALFEVTVPTATLSGFVFGTLPGWWLSTEDWRQQSPCITEKNWDEVLKQSNFSGTDMVFRDFKSDECHGWSVMISTAVDSPSDPQPLSTTAIAVLDLDSTLQREIVEELDVSLKGIGGTTFQMMSLHDAALLEDKSNKHFVFISEIEHPLLRTASSEHFENIKCLLSSSASILWVTAGGGRLLQSPDYGMVQGLRRVSQQENKRIALVTLALDPASRTCKDQAKKIFSIFQPSLFGFKMDEYEPEYVEMDGKLHINRLAEEVGLNEHITRSTTTPRRTQNFRDGPPLRMSMKGLGSLESLKFEEDTTYNDALGADEIEVKVAAVGVNFKECLTVLGRVATDRLGSECSGVVSRVGSNAANIDLKVGDRVVLLGLDTYRTYARTHYQCAIKIPDEMSFAEAAAIPTAFCTAWYSLVEVGRLQKGESILIHTASGGTGQAAVQVAMHIGAKIFATVGSNSKKQLLMEKFKIPAEHIFYSRDTSFAQGIMRVTHNRGVDMVLNSLSGDSLVASWECIAPYGRFIEIGRKDIDSHGNLPMFPFIKNASFSGVDLTAITEQRPELVQRMLQSIMSLVLVKSLRPADPLTVFSISDIEKAFRLLQSGKNSGKIVLEMDPLAQIHVSR
jgi:NADPH:quinone reductase-like Zn-dependent oxidoreductase/ubiquinone/menaquinone biosynthesis C-methylase UbiE